jgi:pantetheine-phosphate adenylyltransferase
MHDTSPRIAVCPGTYDPPTFGHLDIIRRAAGLFDKVIVGVVRSPQHKQPLLPDADRVALLQDALHDVPNVEVEVFSSLVVEFARERGAIAMVKGLRAISDFEWEFQMAHLNKGQAPEIETVFLTTSPRYSFVSSSGVRELAAFGGDVSGYVTPRVERRLHEALAARA